MLLHPTSKLLHPILNQTHLSSRLEAKDKFICSSNSFKHGYRLCYGHRTCQRSFTVYFTAGDGLRSENNSVEESSNEKKEMVPFDIDLAVLLAGFAFESYYTPKENSGIHETDGSECETLFLSQDFVREVYQGQMTVKLIKGVGFPGLDLWGKSDPYVVIRVGQCGARSKTIWVTTDPIWNESFTINVVDPMTQYLQVAAWDENILAPPRRLGNAGISLDKISDGDRHEIDLKLEGIGGGGHVMIEVQYKTFQQIDAERKGWSLSSLFDMFTGNVVGTALSTIIGTEGIKVNDFVNSVLGSLQGLSETTLGVFPMGNVTGSTEPDYSENESDGDKIEEQIQAGSEDIRINLAGNDTLLPSEDSHASDAGDNYWNDLLDVLYGSLRALGIDKLEAPMKNWNWIDNEGLMRVGLQSQKAAEMTYIKSGLMLSDLDMNSEDQEADDNNIVKTAGTSEREANRVSFDLSKQVEAVLGSLLILGASPHKHQNEKCAGEDERIDNQDQNKEYVVDDKGNNNEETVTYTQSAIKVMDEKQREEMRSMFKRAETAMEAWAMLARSLGHTSFVTSEFEKLCFIESKKTDTQVVVWRDQRGCRLVVAFRGTEQTRWKDLMTDLLLIPTGFNPERVKDPGNGEVLVHGGFLAAYDSVKARLISIIKSAISLSSSNGSVPKWHLYVTGHSLGGALATLLTMDISASKLSSRFQDLDITMYNFGSPRVGNKAFADQYNKIVRDSWRVVNHRDIIPTVPRLMGYCHVAQPIYLSAAPLGVLNASVENYLLDEYAGDVIGETTPETIVGEFLNGEKQLLQRLFQTEIAMLRALRDGSAFMQHMEDFYYISLLEKVASKYSGSKLTNQLLPEESIAA